MDEVIRAIQDYFDNPNSSTKRNIIIEYSISTGKDLMDTYIFVSMLEEKSKQININYTSSLVERIIGIYEKDSRVTIIIQSNFKRLIIKNKKHGTR